MKKIINKNKYLYIFLLILFSILILSCQGETGITSMRDNIEEDNSFLMLDDGYYYFVYINTEYLFGKYPVKKTTIIEDNNGKPTVRIKMGFLCLYYDIVTITVPEGTEIRKIVRK